MSQGIAFLMGMLGLGMWRAPADVKHVELEESMVGGAMVALLGRGGWDLKRLLIWLVALVFLCLMAILSNPSENSFRTYLTEMSFRKHLRDLHHTSSTPSTTSRNATSEEGSHLSHLPTPFRFSNHVAITLRTPNYIYRTLHVVSLVCILSSPERTHKRLALVGKNGTKHARRNNDDEDWDAVTLTGVWFVGAFGRWWCMGSMARGAVTMLVGGMRKGRDMVEKGQGVVGVVALPDSRDDVHHDAIFKVTDEPQGKLAASLKHALSSSSLRGRDHSPPPLGPDASLPLHNRTAADSRMLSARMDGKAVATIGGGEQTRQELNQQEKKETIGNGAMTSEKKEDATSFRSLPSNTTPSPVIAELNASLSASVSSVSDLRDQLKTLTASVEHSQLQLQSAVNDLRKKKKDEDADRAELKTRMKGVEENKRQAESAKRDAEKKLKTAEVTRDGIKARIDSMTREIKEMEEERMGCIDEIRESREGREEHARATAIKSADAGRELESTEEELAEEGRLNTELAAKVMKAVDVLQSLIDKSPQAMTVGDEEGHGSAPVTPDGNLHAQPYNMGGGQELGGLHSGTYDSGSGMHDQSVRHALSSRPLSREFHDRHRYDNSSGNFPFSRVSSFKDVTGYEGFGPLGVSAMHGGDAYRAPSIDVDVDEPGSPTGTMSSSFTANLLPQGLFRSLEGDATPVDDDGMDMDDYDPMDYALGHHHIDIPDNSNVITRPGEDVTPPATQAGADEDDESASPRSVTRHSVDFDDDRERHDHHSAEQNTRLSISPSHSSPRRWFSKVKTGITTNDHHGAAAAPHNGSALYGRPLSLTLSNDSLLGAGGQGFESAFAPSAAEKRALRWGSIGRWASNRQTGVADLPVFAAHAQAQRSSAYHASPPGSARSSSVDLTARSAWDHADQASSSGVQASGPGEERSPFRFFSLGKKIDKDAGGWKES